MNDWTGYMIRVDGIKLDFVWDVEGYWLSLAVGGRLSATEKMSFYVNETTLIYVPEDAYEGMRQVQVFEWVEE